MTLLALLLVGGGLGWALLNVLIRNPLAGAAVAFGFMVADHAGVAGHGVTLSGMNVGLNDALFTVFAAAAAARLLRLRRLTGWHHLLLVFAAVALWALISGIATIALMTAVNEARRWVYFFALALYFSTVRPSRQFLDQVGRYWVLAAVIVAGVAVLRWTSIALGFSSLSLGGLLVWPDDELRVLRAREALFIAQGFFIMASVWTLRTRPSERFITLFLLACAIFLQHRSVWIAMAGGLLVLVWRDPRVGPKLGALAVAAVAVGIVLGTTVLGTDTATLEQRAANTQTFGWRVDGWYDLLRSHQHQTSTQLAFGQPFGTGWTRTVDNQIRDESPHSIYVESYLRFGVVGLLAYMALVGLLALSFARSRPDPDGPLLNSDVLLYLLAMQIIFGIPYHPQVGAGLVTGLAISMHFGSRDALRRSEDEYVLAVRRPSPA